MEYTEIKYGFIKIENSIIHFIYKPQEVFDVDMADEVIEDRFKFSNHKCYPALADIRGVKHFTPEARDLMATKGNKLISAIAILIESPVERMIVNTYMNVNKPDKPTRMFTDENRALKWLSKFVQNPEIQND